MRYKFLIYGGNKYVNQYSIDKILRDNSFHWLLNSEIESAEIEIKHNTIIWKNGTFFAGNWYYGIWENGTFHGQWLNGIFVDGDFKGVFTSGIKK